MPIQFRCPHCQKVLSVREEFAGKNGTCNGCQKRLVIPNPSGQPPHPQPLVQHDGPFKVEASSQFTSHSHGTIEGIRTTVLEHFDTAGAAVFRQADLRLSISQCDPGSRVLRYMFPLMAGAARVSIAVSGTVNGTAIHETVNAARYAGALGGSSKGMLDACLQECTGNVLLALDKVAGRKTSSFSQVWSKVQFAKWLAFAVVLVGYAILYAVVQMPRSKIQDTGFNLFILASATFMASVGILGLIAMAALVCAPTDFLKSDPRGIKAISRAGVKNVVGLRIAAVIIGLVACAMFSFAVWGLFDRS